MTNCVFTGNTASSDTYGGGGMFNLNGSSPTVTNCTFSGNSAPHGGGMYNHSNSNATVTNCILWDNTPDEIYNTTSTPIVTYSDVQGDYVGTGNIDADPLFVDAAGGDLRLSSSASPCVDTGDNSAPGLATTDLAGNPRVVDGDVDGTAVVDMGAYEFQTWLIHNITQDLWYEMIQGAIDGASYGDTIKVAAGTYYERITLKNSIAVIGAGESDTTIDGGAAGSVVSSTGCDPNTFISGFTITNGEAAYGGGMLNGSSSPTVTNCTFRRNSTVISGGGMCNQNSSPTLTNCTFSGNTADWDGGGMYNLNSSSPTVTNCVFTGNTASSGSTYGGGGMCNWENSSPKVTDCEFSGNSATYGDGGGMCNSQSSPTINNCVFTSNSCDYGGEGGGMYNYGGSPAVTNCTFSGNYSDYGGGMSNYLSSPTVTNCILWGDEPEEIYNYGTGSATVSYSDVEGGWSGTGNIDADPLFVDAAGGDLHLLSESPCIDAGNSTPLLDASIFQDLDGMIRFVDIVAVPNTGIGPYQFVDMGAYEFNCDSTFAGDVNCDGLVDLKDLGILAANWLEGV